MNPESFSQPNLSQEKQEQTEEKLEVGKKVFEFLERTRFLEIRKSDEKFEEWLQDLSYEDYSNYLTRLNGVLREVPIKERAVDGSAVEIRFGYFSDISYLPPPMEEKENLMRETFDALRHVSDNEDRALLAYYSIQAIHPYNDGNGRTGRLIHELFSEGGKRLNKENLSDLLDHDKKDHSGNGKGRDVFKNKVLDPNGAYYFINREVAKSILGDGFFKEYGGIFYSGTLGVANVPENINLSSKEKALAEKILSEGDVKNFSFRDLIGLKLLQENGNLRDYQYEIDRSLSKEEVVREDVGKKFLAIDAEKFERELTEKDIKRLIEIHKDIKNRFIMTMIDIFKNPDRHQLKNKEGKDVPVKQVFRL